MKPDELVAILVGPTVLDFCESIESKAKACDSGKWRHGRGGEILTDGREATPSYDGAVICESVSPTEANHILANQPRVALAVAAKLREAFSLMHEMSMVMIQLGDPGIGADPESEIAHRVIRRTHALADRMLQFTVMVIP